MASRDSSSQLDLLTLIPGYNPYANRGDAWFSEDAATDAIEFIHECICHVEGDMKGKSFRLELWQQSVMANLFGWYCKDSIGRVVRRYREAFIYVPRKNGKTPWMAALALYVFFCDSEAGQQNYIAAENKEQAGKLFRHMKGMILGEKELRTRCKIYGGTAAAGQSKSVVKVDDETSFVQVISADANAQHGGNTHLVIIDELHAQPDRELVDVLTTSTASLNRKQPLTIYITTADFNRPSICNEKHNYACKVRDGIIVEPTFLPVVYEATLDDDWTMEAVWRRSNPNLGVSVSLDYFHRECKKAKEIPAYENTFKRLHLNIKTESETRAIPMEKWDAYGSANPGSWREQQLKRLVGKECYAGLDLGATSDLTAFALVFPEEDGSYTVLVWYWVPKSSAHKREHRDRVPYLTWAGQGFISLTEGEVTDYDRVRADINKIASEYRIIELAVDRLFQGAQLCSQLLDDGFDVIAFGQGFMSMAAPTKYFLEQVIAGKINHGSNPVLRWNASNASAETDAAGCIKFSKKFSTEKIDGLIACVMGMGRLMEHGDYHGSVYESGESLAL